MGPEYSMKKKIVVVGMIECSQDRFLSLNIAHAPIAMYLVQRAKDKENCRRTQSHPKKPRDGKPPFQFRLVEKWSIGTGGREAVKREKYANFGGIEPRFPNFLFLPDFFTV